jgi:hypothetical protein
MEKMDPNEAIVVRGVERCVRCAPSNPALGSAAVSSLRALDATWLFYLIHPYSEPCTGSPITADTLGRLRGRATTSIPRPCTHILPHAHTQRQQHSHTHTYIHTCRHTRARRDTYIHPPCCGRLMAPLVTHSDALGHRQTEVAAFDARRYGHWTENYHPEAIAWELHKAAAGFWSDPGTGLAPAVATGACVERRAGGPALW